jgi:predicted nucleic acid-binding protein
MFNEDFADRILIFDAAAAIRYAEVATIRRRAGRPIATLDAQIAATAFVAGAVVATRNVRDFEGCGLSLVDPWVAL